MKLEVFINLNGLLTTNNSDDEAVHMLCGDIRLLHTIFELDKDRQLAKDILGESIADIKFYISYKEGESITNLSVKKQQIKQLTKYISEIET